MKKEIENIREELKDFVVQFSSNKEKFLLLKKEEQKNYFEIKLKLAELLLKENKQIAKENTVSLSIPEEHTQVRRLTASQKRIFDTNHREITIMGNLLPDLVDQIRKKDPIFGKQLNSQELNAFYTCLYESMELEKLFDLTLNKPLKNEFYKRHGY
ncbi:hypothetical protein ES707_16037 [subsurface metagenome]